MKPQKIDELEGILCRSDGGRYFFRVYGENDDFTDYELRHSDLCIKIIGDDDDVYIYEAADGSKYIDHSPRTLGIDNKSHLDTRFEFSLNKNAKPN